MTGSDYFLDSSVWLGYFKEEDPGAVSIIEGENNILTSVISLYEISRKLAKHGVGANELQKRVEFIKEISNVVGISLEVAQKAAQDSLKHNLHAIDALIYRSALENGAVLVTMDNDFRKLPGVRIVRQS